MFVTTIFCCLMMAVCSYKLCELKAIKSTPKSWSAVPSPTIKGLTKKAAVCRQMLWLRKTKMTFDLRQKFKLSTSRCLSLAMVKTWNSRAALPRSWASCAYGRQSWTRRNRLLWWKHWWYCSRLGCHHGRTGWSRGRNRWPRTHRRTEKADFTREKTQPCGDYRNANDGIDDQ